MVSQANAPRLALATVTAMSLALATGCGATNDTNSISTVPITTDAHDPSVPPSSAPADPTSSTASPVTTVSPPTSVSPATTMPVPTTPAPTTTAGAPAQPTQAIELAIPTGTFETDSTDLFVQVRSGDLELWSGALTSTPERRTLVADYPDPFDVSGEGTGPNVIDHVAGEVGGAVVFGECCEPISGNVLAATDVGVAAPISGGYSPTLSPTGDLLGTANDYAITQTAADPTGVGLLRLLNDEPQQHLNVADLTWSSNATASADDDHMVLLGWSEDGWWLHDVDRSTLEPTPARDLGVPAVFDAPDTTMAFVGHGPNAEIVVAEGTPDATRLRYFDPTTLAELPPMERSLPGSASSIRLHDDGLGLLWVDGTSLYHLRAGDVEAVRLGTDVLAAWFA